MGRGRRTNLLVSSLLLCAAASMYGQPAFASENWVGSWKLKAAKSSFGSEAVIRSQTLKFETTPAGIKLTSEGTDAQGKPMQGQYTSKFDGKDVAWTGNPFYQATCTPRYGPWLTMLQTLRSVPEPLSQSVSM